MQAVNNILNNLKGFSIDSSIRALRLCINTIWLSLLEDIRIEPLPQWGQAQKL